MKISLLEAVNYSTNILSQIIDNHFSGYMIKSMTIENSFCILKLMILRAFSLNEKNLNNINLKDIKTFKFS